MPSSRASLRRRCSTTSAERDGWSDGCALLGLGDAPDSDGAFAMFESPLTDAVASHRLRNAGARNGAPCVSRRSPDRAPQKTEKNAIGYGAASRGEHDVRQTNGGVVM